MGAAQSSNVATAVANVVNNVSQSTTANSSQVYNQSINTTFQNCSVILSGDFNVDQKADLCIQNDQIVSASQNTNLQNNIQQSMSQVAASTVGFLGVGYANANNAASTTANSSSSVTNDMKVSASQFSSNTFDFTCDDSTIQAHNLNININSTAKYLSTQTLKNDQVTKIVNDVTQTITQKATATVEGISGILIAIILCIAVLIYSTGKAASSPAMKTAITAIVGFVVTGTLIGMYLGKAPPLFSEPNECVKNSKMGIGSDPNVQCINISPRSIAVKQPPLRYNYGILPTDWSTSGGSLLLMSVGAIANTIQGGLGLGYGDNSGYRGDVWQKLDSILTQPLYVQAANTAGVPMIPNPLMVPQSGGKYWQIPKEYRLAKGDNNDARAAKCTPQALQINESSIDQLSDCTGQVASKYLVDGQTTNLSSAIANVNIDAWIAYLSGGTGGADTNDARAAFARFMLLKIATGNAADMHVYIKDFELVEFVDDTGAPQITQAKNAPSGQAHRFVPDNPWDDMRQGVSGSGTVTGEVGIWNTREYQFQQVFKKYLVWIVVALFVFAFYKLWKKPGSASPKIKKT